MSRLVIEWAVGNPRYRRETRPVYKSLFRKWAKFDVAYEDTFLLSKQYYPHLALVRVDIKAYFGATEFGELVVARTASRSLNALWMSLVPRSTEVPCTFSSATLPMFLELVAPVLYMYMYVLSPATSNLVDGDGFVSGRDRMQLLLSHDTANDDQWEDEVEWVCCEKNNDTLFICQGCDALTKRTTCNKKWNERSFCLKNHGSNFEKFDCCGIGSSLWRR